MHILDQLAVRAAAVVAEARERGAKYVEPSAEAVDAWVATIREKAADLYKFQAECTAGYYNNEGMPRGQSESYGVGPLAFHEPPRTWRASGGMGEVLVGRGKRVPVAAV